MYNLRELILNINTDWREILLSLYETEKEYFKEIEDYLNREYKVLGNIASIYPEKDIIFEAFNKFNISELKMVILGQDPYYSPGQAMGLCFSVPDEIKIPLSLKRIYKEVNIDLYDNSSIPKKDYISGDLTHWANQGILLLNTALTVRQAKPNSHSNIWKNFTKNIIKFISNNCENIIFILWGNHAKSYKQYMDVSKHKFLEGAHPSPLSGAKWVGCNHFSKANDILSSLGKKKIEW